VQELGCCYRESWSGVISVEQGQFSAGLLSEDPTSPELNVQGDKDPP